MSKAISIEGTRRNLLESCNDLSTKTSPIHISTCHLYLIDNKQYEKGQKTNSLNIGEFDSR